MSKESTLVLIKPDGVNRGIVGKVIERLESTGLKIVGIKLILIDENLASNHYEEHKDKPFFSSLVDFITSSPVVALALQGENAIQKSRIMMGVTNPLESDPGTIRGDFGLTVEKNIIHGSANEKDAKRELNLKNAQKIFGYFDKGFLIELFEKIFEGNEKGVIKIYKNIYNAGVEPKTFLSDFLEILYYFKNINSLNESTKNLDLNNDEFEAIKKISMNLNSETLILFWQFTINTLGELDIVADQNISIEMFLIRLLHIKSIKMKDNKDHSDIHIKSDEKKLETKIQKKRDPINQIKNVVQEKSLNDIETNKIKTKNISIKSLSDLIDVCNVKKEIKLKYELENNVNLVSFEHGRIEISINEKLEKDFIKILSAKLLEWTKERWMITLSKKTGEKTKKESNEDAKNKLFENAKKTETYKKILQTFSDAELIDIEIKKDE